MTYNKWVVVGCLVACGAMTTVVAQDDLDALLKDLGGAKPAAAKTEAKPAEAPKAEEKPVEMAKPAEEAKPAEAAKEEAKPAEQMAAPAAVVEAPKVEAPKVEEKPAEAAKVEAPKVEEKPVEMAKPAEAAKEEAKPAEQMAAPAAVVEAPKVETPKAEEKPAEAAKVEAPKVEEKSVEMAKPAEEMKPAEAVKEEAKPAEQKEAPAAVVEAPKADAPKTEEAKPVVAEKPNPDAELISEVVTLERIRRQALDDHGSKALEKARKAFRDGDYATARDQYQQALEFIVNRPANDAARKEASDGITEAYYSEARLLLKQGDKERARLMAEESLKRGHPYAARLIDTIRREPLRTEIDSSSITHRVNDREYKENRDEVRRRLRRARQFFTTAEYAKAQEECEIVLRDYPDNAEAIELRERIGTRLKTVADSEFAATRSLMIADVRKTWTPDRYAAESSQLPKGKNEMTEKKEVSRLSDTKTDEQVVAKKLREIVIPEVSFRPPATIIDAVDFFKQASRDYDNPETPVDQRGVNLVLKLSGVSAAAAPVAETAPAAGGAAADPFAAAASSDSSASGAPVIQAMSARFISLYDALKLVCDVTGMKFRIRGNIVMIVPSNDPDSVLISRSYNVLPSLIERMGAVTSELSNNAPKQDGGAFVVKDMGEKSTEDSLKTFFGQMGVAWPQGASISYLSAISKLRVTNTSDELVKFEQILEDLNVTPRLIEIEARFVEVSQKDLNSLGFEWLMNGDFNFNAGKWGPLSHSATTGDGLFGSGSGPGSRDNNMSINGVNGTDYGSGMRYLSTTGNPIAGNGNSVNDKFMKVNAVFGNADLSMILHMLSQRSDTDLLSAPKVVTKPGLEAIMKVVTEYIYPTEFNVQISQQSNSSSISGGGSSDPIAIVEPQNFSMREVGIILQVLPTVSSDGQMIDLVLKPQVVSEPVWKNYGTRLPKQVQKSIWNSITQAFVPTYETEYIELPMEQPFFNVRSVETQISIYNGATVVMGGLITESRKTMEDKVPLLGDIPYLGRLFQSKSEESDKRNLLVFVTARLVDPAGRTVKATGESTLNAVAVPAVPAQGAVEAPKKAE